MGSVTASVADRVLALADFLLQLAFGLVHLAFGLHLPVAHDLAGGILHRAALACLPAPAIRSLSISALLQELHLQDQWRLGPAGSRSLRLCPTARARGREIGSPSRELSLLSMFRTEYQRLPPSTSRTAPVMRAGSGRRRQEGDRIRPSWARRSRAAPILALRRSAPLVTGIGRGSAPCRSGRAGRS